MYLFKRYFIFGKNRKDLEFKKCFNQVKIFKNK